MFFSTISPEYEKNLLDEIWGCFKYVGITSIKEIMSLPIHIRKYFIQKHNAYVDKENEALNKNGSSVVFEGEAINNYSKNEQNFNRQIGKH